MKKPLIGITAATRANDYGWSYQVAFAPNIIAVERAGGLPIIIPSNLSQDTLRALYEQVDGILLPGGGDIDPVNYGREKYPKTAFIDPARDQTELAIARWAADEDRPLFGICRGHQVVNVALGGTLIQDIPDFVGTDYIHAFPSDITPRSHLSHDIKVEEDSRLAGIVKKPVLRVNSIHHQAIDNIAPALRVTALAPDGIIEATELPGNYFYHTVQWHPEDLTDDPTMQALFDALVEAARHAH